MNDFRHVNKHVVQVNVYPNFNDTYVARVYLRSEEAGKDFIVDFPSKRQFIYENYKDNANIKFNINVDDKTMKKLRNYQKKAHTIMTGIKNDADFAKKNMSKRAPNQNPLPNFQNRDGYPMMPQGGFPQMGGMNPPSSMPQMGMPPPNRMPPPPNYGGMPPQMGMPHPMMGGPKTDIENRITKTIQ